MRSAPNTTGFLPVLSVIPTSPSFTDVLWSGSASSNPWMNELGISTTWSQLSNDGSTLVYFMIVTNNSNNTVEYAFLETDL